MKVRIGFTCSREIDWNLSSTLCVSMSTSSPGVATPRGVASMLSVAAANGLNSLNTFLGGELGAAGAGAAERKGTAG